MCDIRGICLNQGHVVEDESGETAEDEADAALYVIGREQCHDHGEVSYEPQ